MRLRLLATIATATLATSAVLVAVVPGTAAAEEMGFDPPDAPAHFIQDNVEIYLEPPTLANNPLVGKGNRGDRVWAICTADSSGWVQIQDDTISRNGFVPSGSVSYVPYEIPSCDRLFPGGY